MRKMPPFGHDVVTNEEIDFFEKKSGIGWDYMTHSLMNKNNQIHGRINKMLAEKDKREKHKNLISQQNGKTKKKLTEVEPTIEEKSLQNTDSSKQLEGTISNAL